MDDESATPPFMMHEMSYMLGDKLGDPIALLMIASFFRDDLPWLYELSLEAYHACGAGSADVAAEAMRRFRRATSNRR